MKTRHLLVLATFLAFGAGAQTILFDFENAQLGSSLPLNLSVGGLTATFSATGAGGYYIQQPQNVIGTVPAGFSGNCLMPSAVYAADLHVAFSAPVTSFSIHYAPQELTCDASANVSVTAYLNGLLVGANTTNATAFCADVPCTWPGQTLAFASAQGFNSVVLHYVAPGSGCQNYGPIFLADNMLVTPAALPMHLANPVTLPSGEFRFAFTNWPNLPFSAFGATNPALPFSNWLSLGSVTESSPGSFLFIDLQATNFTRRFYRVSSP